MAPIDHTQELRPIPTHLPPHDHDLPEHKHDPPHIPNAGVAIGLVWLSMAILSSMFAYIVAFAVGEQRWEKYFSNPDSDGFGLIFIIMFIFVPIGIAVIQTQQILRKR